MSRIKFIAAMTAAKLTRFALKLTGHAASCTPGKVALRLCPDFMSYLKLPEHVICVTGTNGKTTTSNLITSVLRECGYTVTNNSYGSNIQAGVCTALIEDSSLSGKSDKQYAVLEVDERSSLLVYKYITPEYLVCNNIMRDSLKRNANTDFIVYIINKALPAETTVVLNADDFICADLCPDNKKRVYFGMNAEKPAPCDDYHGRDIVYCPDCGTRLKAEYIRYDHIGRIYCPGCGKKSPERDYCVEEIDWNNNRFTVSGRGNQYSLKIVNNNIVNIYNCCGALSVLSELGLPFEKIRDSFEKLKIVSSRYDFVRSGDLSIVMQLAKGQNPVACARAFNYAASGKADEKAVLIMIDDKSDNTNNSESVCWIYDCDYSALTNDSIKQIVFAGKRCRDHKVRALMAGVSPEKIQICDSLFDGADLIDTDKYKNIYVLYDPYILSEACKIRDILKSKGNNDGGKEHDN